MAWNNSTALALAGLGAASIIAATKLQSQVQCDIVPKASRSGDYPEEIKAELFARILSFFGEEGLKKLENSFVVVSKRYLMFDPADLGQVVGLGGVGSHCAHMLVRSGIGRLRLIDFDQVTLSSLNRHALATLEDVGISKAVTMQRRLQAIVPWCSVEPITAMFKMEDADMLLAGRPAFVVDCIDDVNTKAELIAYCTQHAIPVLTSMGAGGKADPTRLRIAPLSDCINDPLATKIKWKLKKHGMSAEQVMSVFSIEKPVCDLLPLDEEQRANPQDFGTVDYLRLRIMPVLGTSPAIFGQALASYILCALAGKMYEPEVCERLSKSLKHKLRQTFRNNELKRFGSDEGIDLDDEDVEFIVQQVWKGRDAVSNRRFGGHLLPTLTRWDANAPCSPYNLILLLQGDAQKLMDHGHAAFPDELVQKINERLAWAKRVCQEDAPPPTMTVVKKPSLSQTALLSQLLSVAGGVCFGIAIAKVINK